MSDIPVLGEQDEPQATVTDQMLNDPSSDVGDFLPTASGIDLNTIINTWVPVESLKVGGGSVQQQQAGPCSYSGTCRYWQILSIEGFDRVV